MRRTSHLLLLPLLLSFAACQGDDDAVAARVDDLRIEIIRGQGMRAQVRDPAAPAGDEQLAPQPVTVRIVVSPDAEEQQREGVTGPTTRWKLPEVEVRWRTLQSWCSPLLASTPVVNDTATNFFRRPTRTGVCHLVAEGVVAGRVFAADTAVLGVEPGGIARFDSPPVVVWLYNADQPLSWLISEPKDAYGNDVLELGAYTATLTSGAPHISIRGDTLIHADQEAAGSIRVSAGTATRDIVLWALREPETHWWNLSWRCYDLTLPGGGRADSAHFWMDSAVAGKGSVSLRGANVGWKGGLRRRLWVPGEPVRETAIGVTRYAALRPQALVWHNGQTATGTPHGTRYEGGNLCDPTPEGGTWARFAPAQMVRADSIPDREPET
jgi:hypothetical protein